MTATMPVPVDPYNQLNMPGDGPLRPGGQSAPGIPRSDNDLPSKVSAAAGKQAGALQLVRDVFAGNETIKSRQTVYLPKAPGEDEQNYLGRLTRAVFYNVFGHTILGLVGQIFRRDPILGDDVPAQMKPQLENADNSGTHFDVFLREILQDSLIAGHAAILVDYPNTGGTQTAADEKVIQPYFVPIQKDNIVSWRTTIENGQTLLAQLVLKEATLVPDGEFGEAEQVRYRVFTRARATPVAPVVVSVRLLEVQKDKSVKEIEAGTYPTQDEIPIAEIVTSGRRGIFDSQPPLVDLAYLNLTHYQLGSDQMTSMHMTCVPVPVVIGADVNADDGSAKQVTIGPSHFISLPVGGDFKFASHDGKALDNVKQALDDLKSDMGTMGLSMLSPSKRTAETAQAKRLDKSTEDSALAVTARGLQDGAERALYFWSRYLKLNVGTSGGSVKINREFDEQSMQADMLTAWTGAVNAGVPMRLMLDAMQTGELIDPDEDVDEIAAEAAANKAAIEDQKQTNQVAQLAAINGGKKGAAAPPPAAAAA